MKTTQAAAPLAFTFPAVELPIKRALKKKTHTIAIGSGKGGVGKTIFAMNLAHELAAQNYKVLIVDSDFSSPCLHHLFQIQQRKDLLLEFEADVKLDASKLICQTEFQNIDVIFRYPRSLRVGKNNLLIAGRLLRETAKLNYDYVIFDLGSGIEATDIYLFLHAGTKILLGTPEPAVIAENFRFLKTCILKKLEAAYRDDDEKLELISNAYFQSDKNTAGTLKVLIKGEQQSDEKVMSIAKNFQPRFVLNMSRGDDDRTFAQWLDLALKDLFGVGIKFTGNIPFQTNLRRFLRHDSWDLLFADVKKGTDTFQRLTQYLTGKAESEKPHQSGKRALKKMGDFVDVNSLICSNQCSLWQNCNYQMGGHPCRIKYIGFVNQN
ncbi:MAG: MinD/ParA family protein [Calditrichaeota bacterium]|nr:MinD/ParA family protein [Calditrichota bacterium]